MGMSFRPIIFGSAAIYISIPYGITLFPYLRPLPLQFSQSTLNQTNCQYLMYKIYIFSWEQFKKNHRVISKLFTTIIQSIPLIKLLIGMNPSFSTHVLSSNLFFLLSKNTFITWFSQQSFSIIHHYLTSLTCNFVVTIYNSS
jgi:hypothetical protein